VSWILENGIWFDKKRKRLERKKRGSQTFKTRRDLKRFVFGPVVSWSLIDLKAELELVDVLLGGVDSGGGGKGARSFGERNNRHETYSFPDTRGVPSEKEE